MKIKELNITEFGCLSERKITFDTENNGISIIYGENESGKSTILLFIKFMLYGLGRKSASNSERERSLSWSGHTAAGSMCFDYKGREYRIERRYNGAARSGSEQLSFVCLDDGEDIKTELSPGEYLFGVPREVFESSALVGQLAAGDINGEKTAASIQNMLISADESVDTAKILKALDKIRVNYRYKSKQGGSLYDDEQKLSALRRELETARDATLSLDGQIQRLEGARAELELTAHELKIKDELVGEINKINILRRFARLHQAEKQAEELDAKIKSLVAKELKTEFFPTRSHTAELKLYAKNLENAQDILNEKQLAADEAKKQTYDAELAELGAQAEADGDIENVMLKIGTREAAIRSARRLSAGFWALGILGAVVGIVCLILGKYVGAVAFSALAFPAVALISGMTRTKRLRMECKDIYNRYGATDSDTLSNRLEQAKKAILDKRAYEALCKKTQAELEDAKGRAETACEMLEITLKKTSPAVEASVENGNAEYTRLEAFIATHEKLCLERDRLLHFVENENGVLCDYDENELSCSISIDVSLVTPAFEADAARQRVFFLKKKEALEQKIFALGDSVANLRANAKNPLIIADRFAELEAKYRADCEFYDALTLAMESIERAGEVMGGSVMPSIVAQAGKLMSSISGEKYTALRTTSNFALSLDSEGYGVKADFLSGGTRDAAYLSLRMALFMRIFGEELPPLIFDEALCQIDDGRAERILKILSGLADDGVQCLMFTSHKRESAICARADIPYSILQL